MTQGMLMDRPADQVGRAPQINQELGIVSGVVRSLARYNQDSSGFYSENERDYAWWSKIGTMVAGVTTVASAAWVCLAWLSKAGRTVRVLNVSVASASLAESVESFSYGYSTWNDERHYRLQAFRAMTVNAATLCETGQYETARVKIGELGARLASLLAEEGLSDQHRVMVEEIRVASSRVDQRAERLFSYLEKRVVKQAFDQVQGSLVSKSFSRNALLEFLHGLSEIRGLSESDFDKIVKLLIIIQKWTNYDSQFFTTENAEAIQAKALVLAKQVDIIQSLSDTNKLSLELVNLIINHAEDLSVLDEISGQYKARSEMDAIEFAQRMSASIKKFVDLRQTIKDALYDCQAVNQGGVNGNALTFYQESPTKKQCQVLLNQDRALLASIQAAQAKAKASLVPYQTRLQAIKADPALKEVFPVLSEDQLKVLQGDTEKFDPVRQAVEKRIRRNESMLAGLVENLPEPAVA